MEETRAQSAKRLTVMVAPLLTGFSQVTKMVEEEVAIMEGGCTSSGQPGPETRSKQLDQGPLTPCK